MRAPSPSSGRRRARAAVTAAAAILALLAAACRGAPPAPPPDTHPGGELVVQVASYELVAGWDNRFLVGVIGPGNRVVSGGTVGLRFWYLGEERAEGEPRPAGEGTGEFLPLPGEDHSDAVPGDAPHIDGVYRADASFDRPGFYEVEVEANVDGEELRGRAAFQVVAEPAYPAPGDRAPRSENLTLRSDAPLEAIDSRAGLDGEVPDPELHATTIAEAVRAGRPALVVFATPVYCVSRFCGPITDMVAELAGEYGDVAEFIHVEIWRDFREQSINAAAAEWLLRGGDLTEPWVFLIGADGRIVARWDNVATRGEIEPLLERLR